eukprot:771043-Amphidinium_carterae.1
MQSGACGCRRGLALEMHAIDILLVKQREPIFWTPEWRHLGTLSTQTEASLILIEVSAIISTDIGLFRQQNFVGRHFVLVVRNEGTGSWGRGGYISWLGAVKAFHFCDIMQMNPNALNIVVGYAQNFMKWFNTIDKKRLSDITQGEDVTDTLRIDTRLRSYYKLRIESPSQLASKAFGS